MDSINQLFCQSTNYNFKLLPSFNKDFTPCREVYDYSYNDNVNEVVLREIKKPKVINKSCIISTRYLLKQCVDFLIRWNEFTESIHHNHVHMGTQTFSSGFFGRFINMYYYYQFVMARRDMTQYLYFLTTVLDFRIIEGNDVGDRFPVTQIKS